LMSARFHGFQMACPTPMSAGARHCSITSPALDPEGEG
jgi:hypothetical protein